MGNTGVATSFVGSNEPALRDIVRKLQAQNNETKDAKVDIPAWLASRVGGKGAGGSRDAYKGSGKGGRKGGGKSGGKSDGKGGSYRSRSASPGLRSAERSGDDY